MVGGGIEGQHRGREVGLVLLPDRGRKGQPPGGDQERDHTGGRGEILNDFEQLENLEKVAAIFASLNMDYIERIDARGTIEEVQASVLAAVTPILESIERSPN